MGSEELQNYRVHFDGFAKNVLKGFAGFLHCSVTHSREEIWRDETRYVWNTHVIKKKPNLILPTCMPRVRKRRTLQVALEEKKEHRPEELHNQKGNQKNMQGKWLEEEIDVCCERDGEEKRDVGS